MNDSDWQLINYVIVCIVAPPINPTDLTITTPVSNDSSAPPTTTDRSIGITFVIPEEANANGLITRFRVVVRVATSTSDSITTYYLSSMFQPRIQAPPYIALQGLTQQQQGRRRQSGVSTALRVCAH